MKLHDLQKNPDNPRIITDQKRAMLRKALLKFGNLSDFVYNRKTKRLVCGHQRQDAFDTDVVVTITKKYRKPTKTGTVAEGYCELKGERFYYREVWWDAPIEKAAAIAANKGAGDWDLPKLNAALKELSDFDLNFDVDLTMFDQKELAELPSPIEVSGHTRTPGKGKDKPEKDAKPPKCKPGQVYALGSARLRVGEGDLEFCDLILSKWKKFSGEPAILQTKSQRREKQAEKQADA